MSKRILNAPKITIAGAQPHELRHAQDLQFDTYYPGGVYGAASFFVPRDIVSSWGVAPNAKTVITNGFATIYEGYVTTPGIRQSEAIQGAPITCTGAWSNFFEVRRTRKSWADTRIDEEIWKQRAPDGANVVELDWSSIDREARIMIKPDTGKAFLTNNLIGVQYSAPTGQTIKRITLSYDFSEGAQQWRTALYNYTSALNEWVIDATGTGTKDTTLATPATKIELFMQSQANQTPTDNVYAKYTNIVVYTETGTINLSEIAKDVRAMIPELSADVDGVAANALSLVPAYSEGFESYADLLTRYASYGDSSYNPWAVYVGASSLSSDDKPKLFVEQQPVLTSADYLIRLKEKNLVGDIEAEQDISTVVNWVNLEYQNPDGGNVYVTPDDDATLKDTTSIALYGQREGDGPLSVSTSDATLAKNYARRYLAQYKDPQWTVSSGITVRGYIRNAGGKTPACEIRAGMRIKLENWLNDVNGSGLTFLITQTSYNDADETCRISVGKPNTLDVFMARHIQ